MGMEGPVVVDQSILADRSMRKQIDQIAELPDVKRVLALTDMGTSHSETPGSIAVATRKTIYPAFCSNVVNCGMSILRTGLTESDISTEFVSRFCDTVRSRSKAFQPDRNDVKGILSHGTDYIIDNWDCNPEVRSRIEEGGNMFNSTQRTHKIDELVPPWLLRHPNTYEDTPVPSLSGNHFIEFQVVDEILDEETSSEWGLEKDEVVIHLHGDYTLTFYINWHYANRLNYREASSLDEKLKLQASKAAFHLWKGGGPKTFGQNWRSFNDKSLFSGLDPATPQGRRYLEAHHAAMNFGYANRLLVNLCMAKCLSELCPDQAQVELLWDVGHDTIKREQIGDEYYWIHRKAAGNAVPNKPAIVAGSYNMDSFLGKGLPTAESFLSSYDHGSSNVVDWFESNKELQLLDRSTTRYSFKTGNPKREADHIERRPIETIVESLVENEVISPVAWLRPVANIGA